MINKKFVLLCVVYVLLLGAHKFTLAKQDAQVKEKVYYNYSSQYTNIGGQDILATIIEYLQDFDLEHLTFQSNLLQNSNVKNIFVYNISDRRNTTITRDDNKYIEHLLIHNFRHAYSITECLECSNSNIKVSLDKITQHSNLSSNQEIRELGKLLNVDAVLLWGTNIASKNIIYFRLVKTSTGEVIFTNESLRNNIKNFTRKNYSPWSMDLEISSAKFISRDEEDDNSQPEEQNIALPFIGINYKWNDPLNALNAYVAVDVLALTAPLCSALKCSAQKDSKILSSISLYRIELGFENNTQPISTYIKIGSWLFNTADKMTSNLYIGLGMNIVMRNNVFFSIGYSSFFQDLELDTMLENSDETATVTGKTNWNIGVGYKW